MASLLPIYGEQQSLRKLLQSSYLMFLCWFAGKKTRFL